MYTKVMKINPRRMDEEGKRALREAADLLRAGELVAFPTETVYGLGGDAFREDAAGKIYRAKGRPSDNPLIVHISNTGQIERVADGVSEKAEMLMEQFWPGPLTLIFRKREPVPHATTGGLDTVAVRMPEHAVAHMLIEESGVLIAAPSANLSGKPSPTCAEHVYHDLQGRIPMIIDGGPVGIGIESTIVDVTGAVPVILRPGFITEEMLRAVVGEITVDKAVFGQVAEGETPKAPGMKYRHYAPKAELTLFEGEPDKVVAHINELTAQNSEKGVKTGIIACDETKGCYIGKTVLSVGSRQDEEAIAGNLYNILRRFDDLQVDVIYGEAFEQKDLGKAIMNRLLKAAGHRIIKL